jgi:hypothetical protein
MKIGVTLSGADALRRGLSARAKLIAGDAADAASAVLRMEVERVIERENISAPVRVDRMPSARRVAVSGAAAAEREFGTLETEPAPWLAPVLPAARGPMRAAARNAAVRANSISKR